MSNIQKFKEKYSGITDLERELDAIEKMDISNIEKLDRKQILIEKSKVSFINEDFDDDFTRRDAYFDELIIGYGRGSK